MRSMCFIFVNNLIFNVARKLVRLTIKPEVVSIPSSKGLFKSEGGFRVDSGLRGLWLWIQAYLARVWTIVSGRHSGLRLFAWVIFFW